MDKGTPDTGAESIPAAATPPAGPANPVALVTGGAVRVGRAVALALAKSGYDLVVGYHASEGPAAELRAHVRRMGRRVRIVRADLSQEADAARLAASAGETFGRLDLLVNSASTYLSGDLLRAPTEEWDLVMAVNVRAPFLLVRDTADLLREARGSVVNVVDLSAVQAWPRYPHHSVSKAALLHLTRNLALALAPAVRANAVAPGHVLPPPGYGEAEIERSRRRVPLGRIGEPEDVAEAVLYLAGAQYVTGEVIVVDGGRLANP